MTTLPQKTNYRFPKPLAPVPAIPPGAHGQATAQGGTQIAMTPGDIWRILRGSMWVIIAIMVLSVIGGIASYVLLNKYMPRYMAKALVQVEPPRQFNVNESIESTSSREAIELEQRTQAELMSQDSLFSRVLVSDTAVRGTEWFKSFGGQTDEAKEDLRDNFVVMPLAGRKLIQVSMESRNAKDSQVIAEAIVRQHIRDRQQAFKDMTLTRSITLSTLIDGLKAQRVTKEVAIGRLLQSLNVDGGGTPGSITPKELELTDLIKRELETKAEVAAAQAQLDAVNQRLQNGEDPPVVLARVDTDPTVINYKQQIDQLDMELATQGEELLNEHTRTTALRKRRDVLQQKLFDTTEELKGRTRVALLDELQGAIAGSNAMLEQVTARIKQVQLDLTELKRQQGEYIQLVQENTQIVEEMNALQAQVNQIANLQNRVESIGISLWAPPELPERPSFPTIPTTLAVALAIGAALSLGFAFLRELLDTTVRSPQDIARIGNINVLGLIPDEADDPEAADVRLPLTIAEAPQSIIAEHIRQVRTRLQQATSLDTTRSILITSPDPEDGKTVISCNLAAGLALNGRKILLVDSNFRRPALHKIFNVSNDVGFGNVLSAPEMLDQCMHQTEVPNLSVLCSGPKPANATELLESQLLIDFIEQALEEFDHVIFDSGPLLFVSDAVALAPRVDGVITVLRAKRSTRGVLQRTRDVLRQLKAEHIGVVLNGVRSHGGGYYGRNIKTYYAYSNEEKAITKKK